MYENIVTSFVLPFQVGNETGTSSIDPDADVKWLLGIRLKSELQMSKEYENDCGR